MFQTSLFLPFHQFAGQDYLLGLAVLAGDIVVVGEAVVELLQKGLSDARALLVDGVLGGVGQIADAFPDPDLQNPVRQLFVYPQKFGVIVVELLENDAFGVVQEEQEHRLGQRRHHDLLVIVGQEDSEILGDDQTA